MDEWRLWHAKHWGTLVARTLSNSWYASPPPLNIPVAELIPILPLLLDSPAAALAWNKLRTSLTDELLLGGFRDAYRLSGLQSEIRARDLHEVLAKLRSAGIEPIVHKGWATARLYPQPELRPYSDIDLLIQPSQLEHARLCLKKPPYIATSIDLIHSEIGTLDPVSWDALYGRSTLVENGAVDIRILGLEHHLRSLCIHCLKHGAANPLWLVDIAVTMEVVPANFDWDLCIGTREPQANWVRCALSLAHRLWSVDIRGTPIPGFLDRLPGWLVRSVLRRWSRPPVPDSLPRLAAVVKSRTSVLEALAWRWPSAGQITIDANASFRRFPNLHLQLRSLLAPKKIKTFVSQLPAVWRATR